MKAKSIKDYLKHRKLTEELHIDGLNFLGEDYDVEVYDARTWGAAQQLVADNDSQPAGSAWGSSEDLFNSNINDTVHLYFFVRHGTNRVINAALSSTTAVAVRYKGIEISLRYRFQNLSGRNDLSCGENVPSSVILPLHFLPNLGYTGDHGVIYNTDRTEIIGSYSGLVPSSTWTDAENSVYMIPETVTSIRPNSFRDYKALAIHIPLSVTFIAAQAFNEYSGTLEFAATGEDDPNLNRQAWSVDWASGFTGEIVWNADVSPEEREAARRQREEEARAEQQRLEQERRAEEERRRREQELQTAEAINVLRYKENKNGITILGCKNGRKRLKIPEEINGKPVTEIAPFAFYHNGSLTWVEVPKTVKAIGKAAFADSTVGLTVKYPEKATLYADAFSGSSVYSQPYTSIN